jgi:drug/metabolite transporter (DMT)-like permease
MTQPRSISVFAVLSVGVMAISCAAIFFRQAIETDPWVAAGWRLVLASVLLSFPLVRAVRAEQVSRDFLKAAALAGVFYAIHFGAWVTSLRYTSVAASVTLVTATPAMLVIWSWWSGHDRPNTKVILAVCVSFVGVVTIGGGDFSLSGDALWGDGLAIIGALAMASYMLHVRRLGVFPVFAFSCVATAVGGALLLLGAGVRGVPLAPDSIRSAVFIGLAALIPQLIGHNAVTWSLRHTTPTIVGLATLVEPVGSAFLAWLIFTELPHGPVIVGCALTLVGVAIAIAGGARSGIKSTKDQPATSPEPE